MADCPVDAYSVQVNGIPSIIVTHRHNDMQKLIFDVLHEIGHINMHIQGEYNGYINLEYSRLNPQEIEANEYV